MNECSMNEKYPFIKSFMINSITISDIQRSELNSLSYINDQDSEIEYNGKWYQVVDVVKKNIENCEFFEIYYCPDLCFKQRLSDDLLIYDVDNETYIEYNGQIFKYISTLNIDPASFHILENVESNRLYQLRTTSNKEVRFISPIYLN